MDTSSVTYLGGGGGGGVGGGGGETCWLLSLPNSNMLIILTLSRLWANLAEDNDIFSCFSQIIGFDIHANCLLQFAPTVKGYFMWENKKISQICCLLN